MLRVDWVARNLSQTGRRGSEFRRVGETPAAQGSLELGVAAGAPPAGVTCLGLGARPSRRRALRQQQQHGSCQCQPASAGGFEMRLGGKRKLSRVLEDRVGVAVARLDWSV